MVWNRTERKRKLYQEIYCLIPADDKTCKTTFQQPNPQSTHSASGTVQRAQYEQIENERTNEGQLELKAHTRFSVLYSLLCLLTERCCMVYARLYKLRQHTIATRIENADVHNNNDNNSNNRTAVEAKTTTTKKTFCGKLNALKLCVCVSTNSTHTHTHCERVSIVSECERVKEAAGSHRTTASPTITTS